MAYLSYSFRRHHHRPTRPHHLFLTCTRVIVIRSWFTVDEP
ncbi:hypothetical protein PVAP13_5NG227481 [Panicum virgatum]|uniref:Uncharacterized protein n=1 Tax=Panicum virgatum TaxID=38727 RepID=A0A8T0RV63_PANVG|nr:hypothetical protein PVAP13_5NG227481 [Panicum virgatum]